MTRFIYMRGEENPDEEGIVIDQNDRTNAQLKEDFGLAVEDICEVDKDCTSWPTDRLLLPE